MDSKFLARKGHHGYSSDHVNVFSATTWTRPNPRFKITLSDSESTILNPASAESAHSGSASLLRQSDAILNARMHDLDVRNT